MLGFNRKAQRSKRNSADDLTKLLFDTFSVRVSSVELSVQRPAKSAREAEPHMKEAVNPQSTGPVTVRSIVLPGGEMGSLPSMTTPTELQVLAFLSEQGPKSAPEIGRIVGRSREHSARLMKKLFQEGYLNR